MKKKYQKFIFRRCFLNQQKNQAEFYYSLDNKINFKEIFSFNQPAPDWKKINPEFLDVILFSLHLAIGIGYYKTFCPPEIILESGKLNKEQAAFWNKLYIKGLGEFFYQNKIDFRGLINFPFSEIKNRLISFTPKDRSLLPLGGGKDSIVAAELLKANQRDFTLFSLRDSLIQTAVAKIIGRERIIMEREIDKKLFALNKAGAYNGHVPISALYAFAGLLAAALYDYKQLIFANEQSANFGNVNYLGEKINHQYSKTLEFEKNLADYVQKFITPNIKIFSLLRPFSELKIVELFSRHKKYFPVFSSCNKNFSLTKKARGKWCGQCPKCAFMFSQLAAFLKKEEALKIFGRNLYVDKKLLNLYLELLGEKALKPFDCVGTSEEVKAALYLALKRGEFKNDFIIKYFTEKILLKIRQPERLAKKVLAGFGQHNIPKNFQKMIKDL